MKYLFLDTNIYIHYNDFEEIDWKLIFKDDVSIVFPPIIMREIDKQKDHGSNARKKKKAKTIASKITDYLIFDKKAKFPVLSCKGPDPSLYEKYSFDRAVNDDVFLLSALQFKEEKDVDVFIVAADNPVLYKAKDLGLAFHILDDRFKLKEEPTDEEKEIAELKKRLKVYEDRKSEPSLRFKANNDILLKIKRPEKISFDDYIQDFIEKEKTAHPHWKIHSDPDALYKDPLTLMSLISEEKIITFNQEVDEYITDFKEYIEVKAQYNYYDVFLYKIELLIGNGGSKPTGDLVIELEFPNTITLYDNSSVEKCNANIPLQPRSNPIEFGSRNLNKILTISDGINGYGINNQIESVKIWNLSKTCSNIIEVFEDKINHGFGKSIDLDGLRVDTRDCKNFSIKYTIYDSELINPVKGSLNVIFED